MIVEGSEVYFARGFHSARLKGYTGIVRKIYEDNSVAVIMMFEGRQDRFIGMLDQLELANVALPTGQSRCKCGSITSLPSGVCCDCKSIKQSKSKLKICGHHIYTHCDCL